HWLKPAEDAVANVIRQGKRSVADPGGKGLDQVGRDRAINHPAVDDLQKDQKGQCNDIRVDSFMCGNLLTTGIETKRREGNCAGHFVASRCYPNHVIARGMLYAFVDRNVGESGKKATCHHQFLASDFVGESAEKNKKRRASNERRSHYDVSRARVDLQYGL